MSSRSDCVIYPSNLNNKSDGSFIGSTAYQAKQVVLKAQKGDVLIFSSVTLNYDSYFQDLFDTMYEKVQKKGVNLILHVPQNWCNGSADGSIPAGCNLIGTFPLEKDSVQKFYKSLIALPRCFPLYTTDSFKIHLKSCDWISMNLQNPQAWIYFGSSNFQVSGHEEVGMYVTGDYSKSNIVLQSVLSRALIIGDYAGLMRCRFGADLLHDPQKVECQPWSEEKSRALKSITTKLQEIGNTYGGARDASDGKWPMTGNESKLYNGWGYPIQGTTKFKLDENETVYCQNGWSIKNSIQNTTPLVASDSRITDGVQLSGHFRIGLTPETDFWWGTFALNIDLTISLINNANRYVKISVMELYLDDASWTPSDLTTQKLFKAIQNAVQRGVHILIVTNPQVCWTKDPKNPCTPKPLAYSIMMYQLTGPGTVQIRYINHGAQGEIDENGLVTKVYEPFSSQHNKMYISENEVIIDCQHPGDGFMYGVYGSSIMLDDKTVRDYYDNYFNSLWSTSSINLSVDSPAGPVLQTPFWNTYPIINPKNKNRDFQSDNWFERKGNLLLCGDDIQDDAAPFSSCCGGTSTNNLTPRVSYEIIFSDPNIMNHLDNSHPKLFFNWWYNQINDCKNGDFIYLVSGPFMNLGSLTYFKTISRPDTCGGNCIGYDGDLKTEALSDLNQKFNTAYKDALNRGVTIYMCAWVNGATNYANNFYEELQEYSNSTTGKVKLYNSPIFWHCKIYATPYAAYTGSQNAIIPDSYELGFAFYENAGKGCINPLYYETLKVCQQFVNIEAGYKELKYNMNNPLEANWVNANDKSCDYCSSFLAISPGNAGPDQMSVSKYATTGFGDNTTTESEAMVEIAQNAQEYLYVCCYDMGYTGTFPMNPNLKWKEGSPASAVIEAANRGVKVKIILSRQGMKKRIDFYNNKKEHGNFQPTALLQFILDALQLKNIEIYVQDSTCITGTEHYINYTRKCHMVHSKFFLSDSSLYNSSSNFEVNYLDGNIRNSGVYTTNQHCIAEVLQFFNWILTVKSASQESCIKRINKLDDLLTCTTACKDDSCSNTSVDTGTIPVFKVDREKIEVLEQCSHRDYGPGGRNGSGFQRNESFEAGIILLIGSLLCICAILYYKHRKKKK